MELGIRGLEVYKVTKNSLKELSIWREDKEVLLKMYAQSVEDWERAVEDARKFGEVNELKNGVTQTNAYHSQKNNYSLKVKVLRKELFTTAEIAKVKEPKKDKQPDISDL